MKGLLAVFLSALFVSATLTPDFRSAHVIPTTATLRSEPSAAASGNPARSGAPDLQAGLGPALGSDPTGAPLPNFLPDRVSRRTQHPVEAAGSVRVAQKRPVVVRKAVETAGRAVAAGLRGGASYYGTGGPGYYGAMHEYRDGTRVVAVVMSFHDGRTWSVTVPITTQCAACRFAPGATLIDLSIPAWKELGWDLSRGIAPVFVQIVEGEL